MNDNTKYSMAYQKRSIKQVKLDLNRNTDADIIAFLDTVDNRSGLIKELIRAYMGGNATLMPPLDK